MKRQQRQRYVQTDNAKSLEQGVGFGLRAGHEAKPAKRTHSTMQRPSGMMRR